MAKVELLCAESKGSADYFFLAGQLADARKCVAAAWREVLAIQSKLKDTIAIQPAGLKGL